MNAQAIAERKDAPPANVEPLPQTDLLGMIERMAVNPNIDTDKLERLIAMKKDMDATAAKVAFNAALVRMQPELPKIAKNGKTDKATYGKWEDIQDAILPVLARFGFALSFKTASTGESITVTAILRHEKGHDDSTDLTLPSDKGPGRNSVQAVGSSVSYGKRYTADALLNLRIGGEDDDGKRAGAGNVISEEQAMEIRDLAESVGANLPAFLKWLKIERLADLPQGKFTTAVSALEAKRGRK